MTNTPIWITAENPLQEIWMMTKSLRSQSVCERILRNKDPKQTLDDCIISRKAAGISFLIQNACDYFEVASTKNLTQRLLNLYYGTLSFIEAEILANSFEYSNLDDIENITKQGHGLYLINQNTHDVGEIGIGILGKDRGLFPAWLKSRGTEIEEIPIKKSKTIDQPYVYKLKNLLYIIPEIAQLMQCVDPDYIAGFFRVSFHIQGNFDSNSLSMEDNTHGSYIALFDDTGTTLPQTVDRISSKLEDIKPYSNNLDNIEKAYTAFIKHSKNENIWYKLNTHKSPFCDNTILVPLLFDINDWEVYATIILYCMSILVRYNPSLWRKIQQGDWDGYAAVFDQFAMVIERVIPHIFYEIITGKKINIKMPGTFGI